MENKKFLKFGYQKHLKKTLYIIEGIFPLSKIPLLEP